MSKTRASSLASPSEEFTPKIPLIGRKEELEWLSRCLAARGERHFVYYKASGGLGKTRLLEELQKLVATAGDGYSSTGIIDLYHTDTHSSSDIERAIVAGLDPQGKYFPNYRRERTEYLRLREAGADPGVLEKRRAALSETFVEDCNRMALYARKLVICFDTVELLQYESTVVEQEAGLDTVDARVKPWMLKALSQLQNVLVVFAGRPKYAAPGEESDPQVRLESDMRAAFGDALRIVELPPLTLDETREFVEALPDGPQLIPADKLPLIHRLSGGRPIWLHLVVDLLRGLSPEPAHVLALFDQWADLAHAGEDDLRLAQARQQIEVALLKSIRTECGELGGYLARIALMPKGVNADILHEALGLPRDEAEQLLTRLRPLSFVKTFVRAPALSISETGLPWEQLHLDRVFLHDEMYRLLNRPDVVTNLRLEERAVAKALVSNYYDREIAALEKELQKETVPEKRLPLRERVQKLQVERLYYLLVQDPREGYREYQVLTDRANRERQVGFAMRLLDEFLRFYNNREQFVAAGISHDQVVRQSAQMWVERFHWWGDYSREITFARKVLDNPTRLSIRPQEDLAILGNVCALWARARAMLYGYEESVAAEAKGYLGRLPPVAECDRNQLLARGRLGTSVGYQYRWAGRFEDAVVVNRDAIAAFRKLGEYPDELAIVLNNQAYTHARQGRFRLATILSDEALQINREMGTDYSLGLSLTNRAAVDRIAGNYHEAIQYAEEALKIFRYLQDPHGIVRAYFNMAFARRKLAKHELDIEVPLRTVPEPLQTAQSDLEGAIREAEQAGLEAELPELRGELGKVYRELGRVTATLQGFDKAMPYFRKGEELLNKALEWKRLNLADQANLLQDLAECQFRAGDSEGAQKRLVEVERTLGEQALIRPGQAMPQAPAQFFLPLAKAEQLRGEMAFQQEDFAEGIRRFLLAYAYYQLFAPEGITGDAAIQRLYWHLRRLPGDRQEKEIGAARQWLDANPVLQQQVAPGFQMLQELLGF